MIAVALLAVSLLPARLQPDPPFPRIVTQAPTIESVAPGVDYGDYALDTSEGPLAVRVVGIETRRSDVRLGTVVANDSLVSRGETIGSMAQRTSAVAGINGDYFDIGNTNRPVNMVIRGGALLQLPYKRYVIAIGRDGTPHIAEFAFTGEIEISQRTMPLDGIDEMPQPGGGLSLLTPLYGRVPPHDDITLVALAPLDGMPPLARYRVTRIADNTSPQPPGYYAAIGLSDYGAVGVPDVGSIVSVGGDLSPLGLSSIVTAVGGGALILHDGAWYDDGDAPYREENVRRMPCSGVAFAADGRLFFVEVDGREPERSVGVTRPAFAALMRSLGASEGLLLDGGGSSTLVVRRLGDEQPQVVNAPSDGKERPVADGLFAYSSAPVGPAVRLIAQPGIVRALPGAQIALRVAAVDAGDHVAAGERPVHVAVSPPSLGEYRDGAFVARHSGSGQLLLSDGALHGDVAVEVSGQPASTRITPLRPNVDVGGSVALVARAFDARGYPLAVPDALAWRATSGSIDARGLFRAGSHDADVSVRIGDVPATARVTVGSHDEALAFAQAAHFVTAPRGGAGSLEKNAGCDGCISLHFSFAGNERAAYAMAEIPLPDDTLGVTFDVLDDGSAGRMRLSVRNEINEDVLLDATRLGNPGWRRVVVRFPAGTQAKHLTAIYVLALKGIELSEGTVTIRNVRAIVAGQ